MDEIALLQSLVHQSARAAPVVHIEDLSDDCEEREFMVAPYEREPESDSDSEGDAGEAAEAEADPEAEAAEPEAEAEQCVDDESDVRSDDDAQSDAGAGGVDIEQLVTLMSAFFQDERGRNVVDALVLNSKVQLGVSKQLKRIAEALERRAT